MADIPSTYALSKAGRLEREDGRELKMGSGLSLNSWGQTFKNLDIKSYSDIIEAKFINYYLYRD